MRGACQLRHRGEVPVHAEHPIGADERGVHRIGRGEALGGVRIGMAVAAQLCTGEACPIDE